MVLRVKNRSFPVVTGNAGAAQKVMVIVEISGFNYVGLILKIDSHGLSRVKNR